jgi:hypothetical protein
MDYANFDDFWHPMVYGQETFGDFFDALPLRLGAIGFGTQ